MRKINVRDLCFIAIFVAIIAVCAQIAFPLSGGVPVTLQAWAIAFAGVLLGPKKGAIAAVVYVLLGMLGAPVFAQLSGGFGVILRPTGGFLLSFPIMAYLAGIGMRRRNVAWLVFWLIAGTVVNWLWGMIHFSIVTSDSLQAAFSAARLQFAFGAAVLPFIPIAVIRTFFVASVGWNVRDDLRKAGVGI